MNFFSVFFFCFWFVIFCELFESSLLTRLSEHTRFLTHAFFVRTSTSSSSNHSQQHHRHNNNKKRTTNVARKKTMATPPILNFLSFTAQIPLHEGEDLRASEAKVIYENKIERSVATSFRRLKMFLLRVKSAKRDDARRGDGDVV